MAERGPLQAVDHRLGDKRNAVADPSGHQVVRDLRRRTGLTTKVAHLRSLGCIKG